MKLTKSVGDYINDLKRLISPFKKSNLRNWLGHSIPQRPRRQKRNYVAGATSRLLKDWPTSGGTADSELYTYLNTLRVRSRDLAKNNDYARRFFNMLITNVVGPRGIQLQARSKDNKGVLDKADNDYLEAEFARWGKLKVCTVDGKLSFKDCQEQFIKTVARDGEAINRIVTDWPRNRFRFALQFREPDELDHELNQTLGNGNSIRLGIEFDKFKSPVAYYFKKSTTPTTVFSESYQYFDQHERIPAKEIIHEFTLDRIGQSRGVPWMHTAARRLQMLGGYEEAELVAARTAAAKMGFFKSQTGGEYVGADPDPDDPTKTPVMNAEPGTFEQLPEGMDFVGWDPDHPVAAYEAFVLAILRGVASGLNVSYVNLANDLRGVSYSSIRQGSLYENDAWRSLQGWLSEHYLQVVYENWLEWCLSVGVLNLPPGKFNKFNDVVWQARGWQWVDPLKEQKANANAVATLQKSPQQIAAEQGRDWTEVLEEIIQAQELAKEKGAAGFVFDKDWNQGAENEKTFE